MSTITIGVWFQTRFLLPHSFEPFKMSIKGETYPFSHFSGSRRSALETGYFLIFNVCPDGLVFPVFYVSDPGLWDNINRH